MVINLQALLRSDNSIGYICCYGIVLMCHNLFIPAINVGHFNFNQLKNNKLNNTTKWIGHILVLL